jgi:DegV family protein with EDD domain
MIRIVTDTDANLPQSVLDEFNIVAVPIHIIFGDQVMRERVDFTDAEAFARMSAAPELPTTSQPAPGDFKDAYDAILSASPDATIMSIHVSGKVSGTVVSARQAAELFPNADIRLFDTLSASLGQGLMVREAARLARDGASAEDILTQLEIMRDGMRVLFVLNTLEYLARGGRIGKASHLMGTLLDLKPILKLEDGVIDAHSRQRTWKRAVFAIKSLVLEKEQGASGPLHIGIIHAVSEDQARSMADDFNRQLNPTVSLLGEIGPGLGVHTGPGALGVCWVRLPE